MNGTYVGYVRLPEAGPAAVPDRAGRHGCGGGDTVYVGNDMYRDIFGAREAGMRTVMFDSDQRTKAHQDCVPDYTITDMRQLLDILEQPDGMSR